MSLGVFHFCYSYQVKYFQNYLGKVVTFSDKSEGGCSEIGLIQFNDTLGFWLKLEDYPDGRNWPWAEVQIQVDKFIDIADFDFIEFDVKSSKQNKQAFKIGLNYPDESSLPVHSLSQLASIDTCYSHVRLSLSDFKTPNWWLINKKIERVKLEDHNYKELFYFAIGAGRDSKRNEREDIYMHSLKATKYIYWPYFVFVGVFFTISLMVFLRFLVRNYHVKRERKVIVEYVASPEIETPTEPSVIDFLNVNYARRALSLQDVSRELGLSETKVSQQIKNESSLTFKQFKNKIRIDKAKKLLIDTDLKIVDIAERVGFDNVTSFNRVFKKINNESPSIFRSLKKKDSPQNP